MATTELLPPAVDAPPPAVARRSTPLRPGLVAAALMVPMGALIVRAGTWSSPSGLRVSLFDDAMISMSYGRTLAETGELVWFPGAPRVEGVTNLGWSLVMAVLHRLGLPPSGVSLLVIALGVAAVWATARAARSVTAAIAGTGARRVGLVTVLAVAGCFPLLWWTLRGMEVGVVTLLTVVALQRALALADRRDGAPDAVLAAAIGLGVLVRTDFAVVAGGIALWLLLDRGVVDRRRKVLWVAASTVAALAACTAFRLWYFGSPVPNTYHLKLTGVSLVDRLERGVWASAVGLVGSFIGPVATVAAGWRLSAPGRRAARLVLLTAALGVLYSIYVGADAWEYFLVPNRYLTPSLVLVLIVAAAVVVAAGARPDPTTVDDRARHRLLVGLVLTGLGPLLAYALVVAFPRPDLAIASGVDRTLWMALALPVAGAGAIAAVALRRRAGVGLRRTLVTATFGIGLAASAAGLLSSTIGAVDDSALHAAYGAQVAAVTRDGAVVAFSAAGGPQYFADRPAVDLLGKSDEHVARQPPADPEVMWPGHDKHDYAHSIGVLRPDVVAHVSAGLGAEDLLGWGYRPYALTVGAFNDSAPSVCGRTVLWARPSSPEVRWDRLAPVDPAACA